jgi:hypothetical protein
MMIIPNRVRVLAVMLALALAGGLLTLALLAKPSQAQPPTDNENRGANSDRFEIGVDFDVSDCQGGSIQLTGTVNSVDRYYENDKGYHLLFHANFANGRGVGIPSGEEYIITSTGGTTENFVPAGSLVRNTVEIQLFVGKGQADNLVVHTLVHYIIEVVEGEEPTVKMEKIESFTKCQG